MADYVKRKIVEKLARFTKDLKPSDISLSFLSGKGELHNLELDALFITEVLQLPPWLQVTRVVCDTIRGRVPFTSLRTDPVTFYVGKVSIEVSTCTDEGPRAKHSDLLKKIGGGKPSKYGFTEKVIDGMRVEIRSIVVRFQDPTFQAQLDMTDIVIQSTTPDWSPAHSLAHTRHKIVDEDSVVIFKMASWSNLKLEGWSATTPTDPKIEQHDSKIRLIAGETKIHVAFKRLMSDSSMMATRISVHLGDIIWIVTQTQLRAVSRLVQSLMQAAVRTAQASRHGDSDNESVDSLESTTSTASSEVGGGKQTEKGGDKKGDKSTKKSQSSKASLSAKERAIKQRITDYRDGRQTVPAYEVIQDSFHLHSGKIALHLCDDTEDSHTAQGSMLLELCKLVIDVYFDEPAGVGRAHWNEANDLTDKNAKWSKKLIQRASKTQFMDFPSINLIKLRERGVVIRCGDFSVHALKSGQSTKNVLPVISCDKKTFCIPDDIYNPAFQIGLTFYHYPPEYSDKFSSPRPNVFIYFSPLHINVDQRSCLWLVEFVYGVVRTVNMELAVTVHDEGKTFIESRKAETVETHQLPGIDAKVKILFTKVTIPLPGAVVVEDGRPKALQIETAAIKAKNRTLETLLGNPFFKNATHGMKNGWAFETQDTNQFPHFSNDVQSLPSRLRELIELVLQCGRRKSVSSVSSSSEQRLTSEEDRTRKLDLATMEGWHVHTECVHVSFADSYSHEATLYTTTFVEDFPVHIWLFPPRPDMDSTLPRSTTSTPSHPHSPQPHKPDPMFSFIAHAPDVISAELNRSQLLFLMRLKDSVTMFKNSLMAFLDTSTFIPPRRSPSPSRGSQESTRQTDSPSDLLKEEGEAPKCISGCVIVEHVEANILLPSIYTSRSNSTVPDEPTTPQAGEDIKGVTPSVLNSTKSEIEPSEPSINLTLSSVSPNSSQTNLTSSQATHTSSDILTSSQSTGLSTSMTDSPVVHVPPSPGQTSLTSSQASVPVNNETVSVASLPVILETDQKPEHPQMSRMYSSTSNIANLRQSPKVASKSQSTSNLHSEHHMSPLPDRTVSSPLCSHLSVDTRRSLSSSNPSSVCSSTEDIGPSPTVSPCSIDEDFVIVDEPVPKTSNTVVERQLLSDTEVTVKVTPPPVEDLKDDKVKRKRQMRSPPPLSSRKVRSPTPIRNEPQYILCIKVDGIHALPNILTSGAISARLNADSINIREVKKDDYEQLKEEGKFKRTPKQEKRTEQCTHPVVKARIELGDQVARFFPEGVTEADAILIAKATGLEIGLLVQNMTVLKDFFDDEFESVIPIPMHLRIDNTKLVILESPGDGPDHWKSLSVGVNQADIHRGRSLADGVNVFMDGGQGSESSTGRLSEGGDEHENSIPEPTEIQTQELQDSNTQLLHSFESFISNFEDHMKLHGYQIPPQPDHIAGVIAELQTSIVAQQHIISDDLDHKHNPPPPYSEAVSVMVTSHMQSSASGSNSEVIRLRRENEELRQLQLDRDKLNSQLVESQNKLEHQVLDLDMVTEECKKAKEELVVYKQVLEKQQEHIEKLLSDNFDLRKKTGFV